jgi:phage tail sheath protein FI
MPEYLSPGVYVEEISTGAKPIEGVGTSTAGFLGATERGPEPPRLITSWLEFQRWYGGYIPDISYLSYAVQGFFDNGGQRCFIGRVASKTADVTTGKLDKLNVWAASRGAWGNRLLVKVEDATINPNPGQSNPWFKLTVLYYDQAYPEVFKDDGALATDFVDPTSTKPEDLTSRKRKGPTVAEVFDNLTHKVGAANNAETIINSASRLVRVFWDADSTRPVNSVGNKFAVLGNNGDDGAALGVADFEGNLDLVGGSADTHEVLGRGRGLAAMETVDEVALLAVPDEVRSGLGEITNKVINQCEILKDRFALIATLQGKSDVTQIPSRRDTSYAAFYYPWIEIYDVSTSSTRLIPPTGHVAGVIARTDIERGVHKAPANEVVRGALNLEFTVTKGMQDMLNPKGVNCMRDFRANGRGIRLWGARTMSSDGEWKYVNVRRLFIFVEESIEEGTQWVVFEPNYEATWARVARSITNFLIRVWRSGALAGITQDEAFFVKCDRTTMTQDDIDNGRLICYIGIAPVKPAEFVIFRISQKTVEAVAT